MSGATGSTLHFLILIDNKQPLNQEITIYHSTTYFRLIQE